MPTSASPPFRWLPPELPPGLVHRQRLLDILRLRFDRPLTAVVGGTGFGKTTLLAQAVFENRLDPLGVDRWLSLTDRDRHPEHLLAGLAAAAGGDPAAAADVDHVVEIVWSQAPTDIAFLLDDVHVLDGSAAWHTVERLCGRLPTNGHLVLTGRTMPRLPLRAMQAGRRAEVLVEDLLAFRPGELDELVRSRGLEASVAGHLPAWPALAVLMMNVGRQASLEFLWESILQSLDTERLHALALLVRFERIDAELVAGVVGNEWSVGRLLEGLPLIEVNGDESRFHDLWQAALADVAKPSEWKRALAAGAEVLLARGELVRAVRCLSVAESNERLVDAVRRFASSSVSVGLSRADAEVLGDALPVSVRDSPLASYLTALRLGLLETGEYPHHLHAILRSAVDEGDDEMAALALWRICQFQADIDPAALEVGDELRRLAEAGWPLARSAVAMIASHRAEQRRDVTGALAVLSDYDALDPTTLRVGIASRLVSLGHPERVPASLDAVLASGVSEPVVAQAIWLRGDIDPCEAWSIAAPLPNQYRRRQMASVQVPLLGVVASVAIAAGEIGAARRLATSAIEEAHVLAPRVRIFGRVAEALVVLADEGEQPAIALLDELLADVPLEPWPAWGYLGALTPIRAFVAGAEWLDELEMGLAMRTAVAAGRAVVELRAGNVGPAEALPWTSTNLLRVHVPPPLLCELAVAARGRVAAAGVCLDRIPGALRWIRALTTHPVPQVRDGARAVTARSPLRPDYDLQIRCFGELTVSRSDGVPVSERGRGGRVQQLLAWLLLEAAPSRSALAGSLWPDLTPKQAAANLRVTLASLLDYIEPDREPSSSWFVRTSNGRLQLTDEGVTIDVRTFEHHIDQARVAERSGAPSLALGHFRTAFDHYAGDFLPVLDDTDVVHERLRLQTLAYNAGCRVSELLLAKGEPEQALRATACARKIDHLAERAYRTEIRCHLALGALTSARAAARHLLAMLADERLLPDRETEQLLAKVDPS